MTPSTRAWLPCVFLSCVLAACGREAPPAADTSPNPPAATSIAASEPVLMVANNNGAMRFDGAVGDAATQAQLQRALTDAYGATGSGSIRVVAGATPASWADGLPSFLHELKTPGAMVRFEGQRISLSGMVSDADRIALRAHAAAAFPGHALTGLFEGADAAAAEAIAPGTQALLERLRKVEVAFEPESAVIAPASLDALSRAARVIRGSDAASIAVGVHPEISDHPEFDIDLARERANAVKNQLVVNGVSPARLALQTLPVPQSRGDGGTVEFAAP